MSIETQKMELRSSLKALNYKKSQVACKMAEEVGITGYFFSDALPFDDPRINPSDVEKFQELSNKIYKCTWELDKLEHIDEPERHNARQEVFDFISLLSLEESIDFLRDNGCRNTFDLVEKVMQNPQFIEEAIL